MILFILKYRKWIGYGIAVLAILAIFFAYRHSLITTGRREGLIQGRAEIQAQWDASIEAANREVTRKDAAYQALQGERDRMAAQVQALLNRPPVAPRLLIREVPTDAPVSTCPRLSPVFMQSYNAAADAADH